MPESKFFISYSRGESGYVAATIHNRLAEHFGSAYTFLDVHAIPAGMDFRKALTDGVSSCRAMVVLMDEQWVAQRRERDALHDNGTPDWIRFEVEQALQRDIPVIPVLLDRALPPRPEDLPSSLKDLAFRNAIEIRSGSDFDHHLERLVQALHDTGGLGPAIKPGGRRLGRSLTVGAMAVAGAFGGYSWLIRPAPDAWSYSVGQTQVGMRVSLTHPASWVSATGPAIPLSFQSAAINPSAGGLALQLPDKRGGIVAGIDDFGPMHSIDSTLSIWRARYTVGTIAVDPAREISGDVYQAILRPQNGRDAAGVLHVVVQRTPAGDLVLWRAVLGDPARERETLRITVDSLQVLADK
ncbi:MAG: toll/interleukin-1 receptor domain-containing protein [Gemmatimonadaceae bacterium]|nr:toll/interleukin-1 receptor domain-containing protein [Gemmatimonadaceae bacterium]